MDIVCGQCGGENLERDRGAPSSGEIPLVCLDCGWHGVRTPQVSCPRCASTEVDEIAIDGWAYGDLEEAREDPASASWGYVDKTLYRCRKCRSEWQVAGQYRPYAPE
jgi:predicted RNA-binding Zn-ribbon protein involved in translation (DUF1610 family)